MKNAGIVNPRVVHAVQRKGNGRRVSSATVMIRGVVDDMMRMNGIELGIAQSLDRGIEGNGQEIGILFERGRRRDIAIDPGDILVVTS
jgi:hypothetical protein